MSKMGKKKFSVLELDASEERILILEAEVEKKRP